MKITPSAKLPIFNWSTHLLVRTCKFSPKSEDYENNLPLWLFRAKLGEISANCNICQVLHFDECHKKQVLGMSTFSW